MKIINNNIDAFLSILKAGLWEQEVRLMQFEGIDFGVVYRLAKEQSVVGVTLAGLEHIVDVNVPQDELLDFVGTALQLEKRNVAINGFVAKLTEILQESGVSFLMVKGQGVGQCYERPLWRMAGDVDLLMDTDNYNNAKEVLFPISYDIQIENLKKKHLALRIMGVDVELHGMMPFSLSGKVDKVINSVLEDALNDGGVYTLRMNETDILLPNPDNHLFIIFTHFLHHFFIEGVGLRQICDWCRILWTYKDSLDEFLLEKRLKDSRLMSEWRVFASLAVNTLGMPEEAMPFYDNSPCYRRKSQRILCCIIKNGNFGHNKDLSYRIKYSGLVYKLVSLFRRFKDFVGLTLVFPIDSPKFFFTYCINKVYKTV